MKDVPQIQKLVNEYASDGLMLALSLGVLYDRMRDFFVYEENDEVIGVAALHFSWEGLAEIRSLAVKKEHNRKGVAKKLISTLMEEAKEFGCKRVFTLTFVPDFFRKIDFKDIDKGELPHKVWADCINCPHFPDCNEVPLAYDFAD
jgi:amino-acid N-acetyltransferase